jgi:hypothetical protein
MDDKRQLPGPNWQPIAFGCLWPVLAFLGTLVLGLVVTVLVVRSIPPEVPHPTEAYEGFGDAVTAAIHLFIGTLLSFLIALIVACFVAVRFSVEVKAEQREHDNAAGLASD